jgi:hypothetical protein
VILAEAVSFSGEEVFFILLVLAVFALATLALVVLGFVWAARGGRGSEAATAGFVIVLILEFLTLVSAIANHSVWLWPVVLMGAQLAVYLRARRRPPPSE